MLIEKKLKEKIKIIQDFNIISSYSKRLWESFKNIDAR